MSKKNINVAYWVQSTGVTGQCLTERGQKLFDTTSALYHQVTGEKLSKMKLYDVEQQAQTDLVDSGQDIPTPQVNTEDWKF